MSIRAISYIVALYRGLGLGLSMRVFVFGIQFGNLHRGGGWWGPVCIVLLTLSLVYWGVSRELGIFGVKLLRSLRRRGCDWVFKSLNLQPIHERSVAIPLFRISHLRVWLP